MLATSIAPASWPGIKLY